MEKRMKELVLENYKSLAEHAPEGVTDLLDVIEYWADTEDDPERRGDYCWLLGAADALDMTISELVEEARR